ncbi:MAG: glycosyltransferase [Thermoanaerobaculaceae bacterium]|nr:glycosyltransferase [Thermoanaerobaculaceae bacterium]
MRYHPAVETVRLLVLTARPPWPPRRGDQARVAGLLTHLAGRHELHVLALHPAGIETAPAPASIPLATHRADLLQQARALARHPHRPLQVAIHSLPSFERAVARAVQLHRPEVVLLVLSRLAGLLPALAGLPVVLDFIDSLSLNMARRAQRQQLLAPLFRFEAQRMAAWDRWALGQVRCGVTVCQRDAAAIAGSSEELARRLAVVPFGVSVPEEPPHLREGESVVLLSGNLGYFPTVDGARYFARHVWPLVREYHPSAAFWLAGSRPPRAVRRLTRLPHVSLWANPEELTPFFQRAAVAVVPLRSGSGTPIKVLEAMAHGIPVVATPEAAAGLDRLPPEALTVAADAPAFAAATAHLLSDAHAAHRQAVAAWEWVRATHSLPVVTATFEEILASAAAP